MCKSTCIDCDYMSVPFRGLTTDALKEISAYCISKHFLKGEKIFMEGMPIGDITYLKNGIIKNQKKINDQKCIIFQVIRSPAYFGLPSVFGGNIYHTSAEAATDAQVCFIQKGKFFEFMHKEGSFALSLLKENSRSVLQFIDHTITLLRQQVPGRLADVLLFFSGRDSQQNLTFELPLNRSELADFMGVSTKSLTRTLKEFNDDGLIKVDGRKIEIIRPDLLKRLIRLG